ncbi:hypothetical protein QSJ19_07830 [Gordonia sp. ABSL11-1]|nr:hypothetical protein [Gordonia sp. ABSL11-1]MDL9945502.1 hypothetical protein [Gordonia sp. ABSL11-1]
MRSSRCSLVLGQGFAGPEMVAAVVAMPASQDASSMTGAGIRVDGGSHG